MPNKVTANGLTANDVGEWRCRKPEHGRHWWASWVTTAAATSLMPIRCGEEHETSFQLKNFNDLIMDARWP